MTHVSPMPPRPAVFMDRDGTLNGGFNVNTVDQFELYPFAAEAVLALNKAGRLAIVVTNQGGVALGKMSEEELTAIHDKMERDLARGGARLDGVYASFYHRETEDPRYMKLAEWRKPLPGMLLHGARELAADLARSWIVGDRPDDIRAGRAAGVRTALVLTGHGPQALKELEAAGTPPDLVACDLLAAVRAILGMVLRTAHDGDAAKSCDRRDERGPA